MRLISATLRNYRIHFERTIEFDRFRTLIGGPNESGKSTLIEAIHRALFFRANSGGQVQKQMVSQMHVGHPEVEVRFSVDDVEYALAKRFSGANGTCKLTQIGGETWQGDEAEERLAKLLGSDESIGGNGAANKLAQQWAHLWTWQGRSGDDPCELPGTPHLDLVQRLQESGGAAVFQSDCDTRVAQEFKRKRENLFLQNNKPRAGSDLQRAEADVAKAATEHQRAVADLQALREAVAEFRSATARIEELEASVESVRMQKADVDRKLVELGKLRQQEALHAATAEAARQQHADAEAANTRIDTRRSEIQALKESLAPGRDELKRAEERRVAAHARGEEAAHRYDEALGHSRSARMREELAGIRVVNFETKNRLHELTIRSEQVAALREEMGGLREMLAKLPVVDAKGLKKLEKLQSEIAQAEATLRGMAAGIEILASPEPVQVGNATLFAGASHTVTETTELQVGPSLRLRIHPGGGDSLETARMELQKRLTSLRTLLDDFGIPSVDEASEIVVRRAHLEEQLARKQISFDAHAPEKLVRDMDIVRQELAELDGELVRRTGQLSDGEVPENLERAKTLRQRASEELRHAENAEKEARAQRDASTAALKEAEAACQRSRDAVEREERELKDREAQLRLLLETHGDDASRLRKLEEARVGKEKAAGILEGTRRTIAAMEPEKLEGDRERLGRALREIENGIQEARIRRSVAGDKLRSDGSGDPEADLAHAEARLAAARLRQDSLRRRADAIRLLDDLFTEEQQALSERFTGPFVEKVSAYLQSLFGGGARVAVELRDNRFTGVRLDRPHEETTFAFETLSGGAREQVAAAVRLAMAEVLAAGHDGCLPIVFDDAFANSDPERVRDLQRMLDLAANRGLQVIVLSCNPGEYAGLGARQIALAASTDAPTVRSEEEDDAYMPVSSGK